LAVRPGGSTAVGRVGERPALLLPGQPFSALTAYALLAAPLLRKMAGWSAPPAPAPLRLSFLQRKLASELGMLDVFPVRFDEDGVAHSLGEPALLGPTALAADGVVLVAEDSEGLRAGSEAAVYSLDGPLPCGVEPSWRY
ncbi:MAG TPA: molybdopterin biosynthesis protein, partial [Azospirillaceae bacterium]|nr:molybdopterin biosynthesis protein [Azospirillaceae bacterium]